MEKMEKKEAMVVHVSKGLEEMEGAHRAPGISSSEWTSGNVNVPVGSPRFRGTSIWSLIRLAEDSRGRNRMSLP